MGKITIIEPNSSDQENIRAYMVKGERGDDGVSPTITTSKTDKVTTITITDKDGTKTAQINDGNDGRDLTGGVPTNSVIGWLGDELIYTCDGTESGNYYFTYDSDNYYFTMPTVAEGDILLFNTTDTELSLDGTTISTSSSGTGTELTFIDNIPNGYELTDEPFPSSGGTTVHDSYSTSTTEPYSANYVNGLGSINIISDTEVKLNYKFNSSDVYFKRVSISAFPDSTSITINTDISNGTLIRSNIYMDDGSSYILLPYVASTSQLANVVNGSVRKDCTKISLTAGTDRSSLSGFADIWYTKSSS